MRPALARHDEILRAAIAAHEGHYVKTTGDGAREKAAEMLAVEHGLQLAEMVGPTT